MIMKTIIFTCLLLLALTAKADGCTTYTVMENGEIHAYMSCCYGDSCTVTRMY